MLKDFSDKEIEVLTDLYFQRFQIAIDKDEAVILLSMLVDFYKSIHGLNDMDVIEY